MSDRVEFKKGVSTAVMGDLHEAPRLSNVVTLHVGDKQTEVELITDFQRRAIAQQIAELVELTGEGKMTFYKKFIRDYGLERFKELPRQHYQEVNSKLEQWIRDAKSRDISTPAKVINAMQSPPHEQHHQQIQPQPQYQSAPCMACVEKSASFARLQRSNRIQLLALTACALLCGWLIYKVQAPLTDGQQAAADQKCFIAGNAYSVGYIAREKGRAAMECAQPAVGMPAVWREVGRTR